MKRPLSPREELIRIQRVLVERYAREIEETLEDESGDIRKYQDEHDAEVNDYSRVSGKAELISEIVNADLVYIGDFHSLRPSQRAFLKLIQETHRIHPKICLALESFMARDQKHLDSFLRGKIKIPSLFKRVRFDQTWGFSSDIYEDILSFARENSIRVVGINHQARGTGKLGKRDEHAARIIADLCMESPGHIVFVLDGELHVADCHLPSEVRAALARSNERRRRLILYQNPEKIYWKLAEQKLEQIADVVNIREYRYALLSSTPLVMYQSYLNWLSDQEELNQRYHPDWADEETPDYTSQVHDLIRIISEFLGITEVELDDFTVYSVADLDFLGTLKSSGFSVQDVQDIKSQILKRESYFILGQNIIYLASLSIDHAAEEAAHYINARCAGLQPSMLTQREDFYQQIMRESLGFFGSKIINPKRHFYGLDDFNAILQSRRLPSEGRNRELYQISRYVLMHKEYERDYLAGRTRPSRRFAQAWSQPSDVHLGIAHGLGYMLGEKLFSAVGWGLIERDEVKKLFFENFKRRGSAQRTYMGLVGRLIDLPSAETF